MLHSYLEGAAVEVMVDSDNVVRAALTSKHRDLRELMRLLAIRPWGSEAVEADQEDDNLWSYRPPVEEFQLSRLRLEPGKRFESSEDRSVELWVCTAGEGRIWTKGAPFSFDFHGGDALIVPADVSAYAIEGDGGLFRASVP